MHMTAQGCTCEGDAQERLYAQVNNVIDLYREREGSLIQVLHLAQEIFGYLPPELQEHIARQMNIPASARTGVASFYSFFATTPRGLHTIRVCLGTACYVRGGKKIVSHLQERLGVDLGGTTADGKFTFEIARCIGACGLAPALMVDDRVHKQVNVNKLEQILSQY